jgi:hypothetical protein
LLVAEHPGPAVEGFRDDLFVDAGADRQRRLGDRIPFGEQFIQRDSDRATALVEVAGCCPDGIRQVLEECLRFCPTHQSQLP